MIVLLGKSKKNNTELQKFVECLDIPSVYVDLSGKNPDCAYTPWNYYLYGGPDKSGRPFFWLNLKAPSHWSFRAGDIRQGQICNGDELLARVYFREPLEDQCIDRVEWIRNNEVYAIEYYDASGTKYAEAVINSGTESLVKYYDLNGTATVIAWPVSDFISVRKGRQEKFYESTEQFCRAFMKDLVSCHEGETVFYYEPELHKYIPEGVRSVLFLSDQIPEGLTRQRLPESLSLIVAGSPGISQAVRKLLDSGEGKVAPGIIEIGRVIDRTAGHPVENALIVTRSQNIEQLQYLVEGLPELHFHIAAGTMMAPGLMVFDKYDNVILYPNSPRNRIMDLMGKCAFYLDINHYLEYEGIVAAAQGMDRLVYAFDNTVHQRAWMPKEQIYAPTEVSRMISDISRAMYDSGWLEKQLDAQRELIGITEGQKAELLRYIS